MQSIQRPPLVDPPFCRPNPEQGPSQAPQDLCPDLVAIAGRRRRVVGGPIALNASEIVSGTIRVNHTEIDPEARYANLGVCLPALGTQPIGDELLKRRFVGPKGAVNCARKSLGPTLGELDKMSQ